MHPSEFGSFGPDGTEVTEFRSGGNVTIGRLAFDQLHHRLYVVNQLPGADAAPRIYGFDVSNPGSQPPLVGFPFLAPGGGEGAIAVDDSPASSGDIYYTAPFVLRSYTMDGTPRSGFPAGSGIGGVAVDSAGHVWTASFGTVSIEERDSDGVLIGGVNTFEQGNPIRVAIDDSTGDLYVQKEGFSGGGIWRYTAADEYDGASFLANGGVDFTFDSAHHLLYVLRQDRVDAYDTSGDLVEEFATGFGSSLRGIAVDEESGAVYVSNGTFGLVQIFPGVVVPDATTGDPIGKSTVSGHVDPLEGGDVSSCQFQFGETKSYGNSQPCTPSIPPVYSTPKDVEAILPGLVPEHTYHYRLKAGNANGSSVGSDRTITPHWVDRIKTEDPAGITRFAATLKASFNGTGDDTHYFFEWGTNSAPYDFETPEVDAGTTNGSTSISTSISGLTPGAVYHYRVVAHNGGGFSFGEDRAFEAAPAVLDISTDPAGQIAPRVATLNASFTGTEEDTHYRFEWGPSKFYGSTTPDEDAGVGNNGATTPVSFPLIGLEPETTYHYRVAAHNLTGESAGKDRTFTTLPAVAGVSTDPVTGNTLQSVTLNGSFTGNGDATSYYFDWGPTVAYGNRTAAPPGEGAGAPTGLTHVSAPVTDFKGFTTYHYRFVANTSEGTTYGQDRTFVTVDASVPAVDSTASSGISPTAATVEASIVPNRWDTVYLFEYGPTTSYGSTTLIEGPIGSDLAAHQVSALLAGLEPATLYHFRAVAINFAGTAYGADQTFTTPNVPRIDSSSASAISRSSAHLGASVTANGSPTTVTFDYGTTRAYGRMSAGAAIGAEFSSNQAGLDLGDLAPGTTYHFRVVATNALGTTVGPDQTFTTQAAPEEHIEPPKPCKKGYVKHRGKCVKRHTRHHRRRTRSRGGHG